MKAEEAIYQKGQDLKAYVESELFDGTVESMDLAGVEFIDHVENISDISFIECDMTGCDFRGCIIERTCFDGSHLEDADMTGCDLDDCDFSDANLKGCDLTESKIRHVWPDNKYIKRIHCIDEYVVLYTKDILQVGCQGHDISKWNKLTDRQISAMDTDALSFWHEYKEVIMNHIENNPAEGQ